jgi:prevent-host-death family protein
MTTLNIFEARRNLGATLDRVAADGDRFVLARRGKPLAVLVSPDDLARLEEMEDADDLRAARASLSEHRRNPSGAVTVAEYRTKRNART